MGFWRGGGEEREHLLVRGRGGWWGSGLSVF